jgi:LysM repeat protein
MKRLLFVLFALPLAAKAQDKLLVAEGASPNLYLSHTVAAKENFYSIGRLYNISPKDNLAPFNKLSMDKGLSPGQVIKIPLVAANFLQSGNAAADEALIPVYHVMAEKEGLYRVSVNHNKVPVETLKQWNKITGDAVSNGTKLIVGYLKVKKDLSALAGNAAIPPVVTAPPVKNDNGTVITNPKDAGPPVIGDSPLPPVKNPEKQKEPAVVVPKNDPPKKVEESKSLPSAIVKGTGDNFSGGTFKGIYEIQKGEAVKETGTAGVFKSTSGWDDGKYYCLHNTAQPGTVIKVTNAANGKSIYAKVLDVIPDIKQNTGIIICISNAAADILGAGENKFDCSLNYSK